MQEEERERTGESMRVRALMAVLTCVLTCGLAVGALDASAYREPAKQISNPKGQEDQWIPNDALGHLPFFPAAEQQIEGACGLAISPTGTLYVSDYYHRAVHAFTLSGTYGSTDLLAGGNPPPVLEPIRELNAVCGLAADGAGNLYASEFHQAVLRLPGEAVIDPGKSTGVAVDDKGDLYVDEGTYVAVYEAPVAPGEEPALKIGSGSLTNAYGVAVDSQSGRVYVPDAAGETVKVFDPAGNPSVPVDEIDGPDGKASFNSLANTSLAVDESASEGKGHLLVVDDLKPGFEFPEAAVYEFDSSGNYLDRLQTRTVGPLGEERDGPIFAEPSGIAVDS